MVYVDNFNAKFGRMIMCHLVADTTHELIAMAAKIGVDHKWIQYPGTANEHFDVSLGCKKKALAYGAIEIGFRDYANFVNARKEGKTFVPTPIAPTLNF